MNFLENYGVQIKNPELLKIALTHSSYANENEALDYERLEFLGDAVLQVLTSDYIYNNTDYTEGQMSKLRASYVCETALAGYAKQMGYTGLIKLGEGQKNNLNDTIIADTFESVLGAVYLSNGMDDAKKIVFAIVIPHIKNEDIFMEDYKSLLQELVQTTKQSVEYRLISETGPAHAKKFTMEVWIDDMKFGVGVGKNKKEAEQNAALDAYKKCAK